MAAAVRLSFRRRGLAVRREFRQGAGSDRKASRLMAHMPGSAPPRHEPMFNAPSVVVALAIVLIGVYAAFAWASPEVQDLVIRDFAFAPGRLTVSFWPARAIDLLIRANTDPAALEQARAMRDLRALSGGPKLWTLLTYAFLHGSWTHVLINTIWLVAFGPPVARRFGTMRFLIFMAVTAIFSALAHWVSAPMDFAPLIGASGAVSGLMGAVTRFMFQPGAPLGPQGFGRRGDIEPSSAASLKGILVDPRARIFLGIWLATNFIFGAFAQALGLSDAPVAWVAHLGGFFSGLVLFTLFDRPRRSAV